MCRKSYLVISGIIFGLVAIGHLARLIHHWPVRIADWDFPMSLSWAGLIVAATLSVWAFTALCPAHHHAAGDCKCSTGDACGCHTPGAS